MLLSNNYNVNVLSSYNLQLKRAMKYFITRPVTYVPTHLIFNVVIRLIKNAFTIIFNRL